MLHRKYLNYTIVCFTIKIYSSYPDPFNLISLVNPYTFNIFPWYFVIFFRYSSSKNIHIFSSFFGGASIKSRVKRNLFLFSPKEFIPYFPFEKRLSGSNKFLSQFSSYPKLRLYKDYSSVFQYYRSIEM